MDKHEKLAFEMYTQSIDLSDTKQLAKDLWLFLANDFKKTSSTIQKKAFLFEVKLMLDVVVNHERAKTLSSLKDVILDYTNFRENYRKNERIEYREEVKRVGGVFTCIGATDEVIFEAWEKERKNNERT